MKNKVANFNIHQHHYHFKQNKEVIATKFKEKKTQEKDPFF